jgi:hypothetical protein
MVEKETDTFRRTRSRCSTRLDGSEITCESGPPESAWLIGTDWTQAQCAKDIHFIENMDFLQDSVIFDFAVLMQMDHFILSEGTFGWWAAWLGAWQRDGTVYHSGKNDWENWVDNNGIPGYKAVDGDSHALYFPVLEGATE